MLRDLPIPDGSGGPPEPESGRPQPARSSRPAGLETSHGHATTEDPHAPVQWSLSCSSGGPAGVDVLVAAAADDGPPSGRLTWCKTPIRCARAGPAVGRRHHLCQHGASHLNPPTLQPDFDMLSLIVIAGRSTPIRYTERLAEAGIAASGGQRRRFLRRNGPTGARTCACTNSAATFHRLNSEPPTTPNDTPSNPPDVGRCLLGFSGCRLVLGWTGHLRLGVWATAGWR